jgi:O-acetylserine/cysteine efflux transporter
MPLRDMVLAALTSMVWGFAFIATRLALDSFSAPQLTALRFLIACLPVLFVPRPNIAWPSLVLIGLILFAGQFLPLFLAFGAGMPPGLASVSQQMQASSPSSSPRSSCATCPARGNVSVWSSPSPGWR